jgi:hypothetical protein
MPTITPLHWPPIDKPLWFGMTWLPGTRERLNDVLEQQRLRPPLDPLRWGANPSNVIIGKRICAIVQEHYDWATDRFIPEDPFEIVFLLPYDDLEFEEFALTIEHEFRVKLSDEELQTLVGKTLGYFVDTVVARVMARLAK